MKPVVKYFLVLLIVTVIIGILFRISQPTFANPEQPRRIPTYEEVVPQGLSALSLQRVLDPRDAGILLKPRLPIVKIADRITDEACPEKNDVCMARALLTWVRNHITHVDVLATRDHIISPEETILYREGTDLTLSILLATFYRAEGFHARVGHTTYSTFVEVDTGYHRYRTDPACQTCAIGHIRYAGPEDAITWIE